MKAIVVHQTGGPEELKHEDVPDPEPKDEHLLVRVEAAGLNFIDTYHRGGLYPMDLPITPGLEGAGTVLEVGDGVSEFGSGDRVAWTSGLGSYAEKVNVAAEKAIPLPDNVDSATAAAVALQGITAHYLATDTYQLVPGSRCVIHAGAGGVGLLLTQIAKIKGAEVITTVGTDEKAELSKVAGADHVIVYTRDEFQSEINSKFGAMKVDVVYDGVGAATFAGSLEVLRPRGLMVSFGNASGPAPEVSPLLLMQKGSLYLTRPTIFDYIATRQDLLARAGDLFDWIGSEDLDVRIGAEYALRDAPEAHRALEGRHTTGKVLLRP